MDSRSSFCRNVCTGEKVMSAMISEGSVMGAIFFFELFEPWFYSILCIQRKMSNETVKRGTWAKVKGGSQGREGLCH